MLCGNQGKSNKDQSMEWYYAANNQQQGPVDEVRLAELFQQGVINDKTLVWRNGMAQWQPYGQVKPVAGTSPVGGSASSTPEVPGPVYAPGQGVFGNQEALPTPNVWADSVIDEPVELTVGECFAKSWEMLQRNMLVTIAVLILVFLAQMVLNAVPFLGALASIFLTGPLYGGLLYYFVLMVRGEECRLGNAFSGFGPRFVPLMLAGLLIAIISVVAILPGFGVMVVGVISSGLLKVQPGDAEQAIKALSAGMLVLLIAGGLLTMFLVMFVTMLLQFAYPLILDKGLDVFEAIKLSVRRTLKYWPAVLLLMIAGGFLTFIGALLCGVGLLIAVPWYLGALACAYERLFPGRTTESR